MEKIDHSEGVDYRRSFLDPTKCHSKLEEELDKGLKEAVIYVLKIPLEAGRLAIKSAIKSVSS